MSCDLIVAPQYVMVCEALWNPAPLPLVVLPSLPKIKLDKYPRSACKTWDRKAVVEISSLRATIMGKPGDGTKSVLMLHK